MQPEEVRTELERTNPHLNDNHIVLFTVLNAVYPINVDLIAKICRPIAEPLKIVIFQKVFLQVLVEFKSLEAASKVKDELHSCDIYPSCCTLKAEYAKTEKLNVRRNDSMTWDFTVAGQPEKMVVIDDDDGSKRKTLINHLPPGSSGGSASGGRDATMSPSLVGVLPSSANGGADSVGYSQMGQQAYMSYMSVGVDGTTSGGGSSGSSYDWGGGYNGGSGNYKKSGRSYKNYGGSGTVLMVYGLDEKFNCAGLFNFFCLYGNVLRASFLKNKPGCAMVEMSDPCAVDRIIQNVRGTFIFGQKVSMERSHKQFVEEIRNPHELYDKSPSYLSFTDSRNHRFDTEEKALKNRIVPPSTVLHFYNVPKMEDDDLSAIFGEVGAPAPTTIKWFEAKPNAKTLTGLLKFDTIEEACEALVLANHTQTVKPGVGTHHEIKLCFSKNRE